VLEDSAQSPIGELGIEIQFAGQRKVALAMGRVTNHHGGQEEELVLQRQGQVQRLPGSGRVFQTSGLRGFLLWCRVWAWRSKAMVLFSSLSARAFCLAVVAARKATRCSSQVALSSDWAKASDTLTFG